MALKVEIEYLETPDEAQRAVTIANILGEGVYAHLKQEGKLRSDTRRKERIREVINTAREIINRDIRSDKIDSA